MNFIDVSLLPVVVLEKSYHLHCVLLSVVIASVSFYTAFGILERIQASSTKIQQSLWLVFGSTTIGFGLWSMHFISLLALQLPLPVYFTIKTSLFSFLPAWLAGGVILWFARDAILRWSQLLLGSLLLASLICLLHYLSISMMELNADVAYSKSLLLLSFFTSIVLSVMILKIMIDKRNQDKDCFINKAQLLSALIMGVGLSCHYCIATYAVTFIPLGGSNHIATEDYQSVLLAVISALVFIVLGIALIAPYGSRFRQRAEKNEQALQIVEAVFQSHDAMMVVDKDFKIMRINPAFTDIMGYTEEDVIGRTPELLNLNYNETWFQDTVKKTIHAEGVWQEAVESQSKHGEVFSKWQSISAIKNKHHEITHYIFFFIDTKTITLANNDIEKLAFYDELTDLPNRRLLYERLNHELNIARRYLRAGVLLFLDLDRFRDINNSFGHAAGDVVLIETAKRLQSLLRDTDTAVRLGGDEFVILSSAQDGIDANLTEQAQAIAEKIIQVILEPYFIEGQTLYLSASIGITLYTGIDETVESLLKRADAAMYQAKAAGRNNYCFYQQSMQDAVNDQLSIERNLSLAMSQNEFSLSYQPQYKDEKTMLGVEALLRWESKNLGKVPPAEFIPIAEANGLILSIGQWVIEAVCEQIIRWDQEGIHIPHVAINISAKQFHQANFASTLSYIVSGYQVKPERMMLEVTESIFQGKFEDISDKMYALKKKGFKFSIDDFGTGQSSLTYLKRLPFDQLKIDQSFVKEFINQPTDVAIVKAIVSIAKGLKIDLIAEGVETEEHFRLLFGFGCDGYQGNYFSQPLSVEQLEGHIRLLQKKS